MNFCLRHQEGSQAAYGSYFGALVTYEFFLPHLKSPLWRRKEGLIFIGAGFHPKLTANQRFLVPVWSGVEEADSCLAARLEAMGKAGKLALKIECESNQWSSII